MSLSSGPDVSRVLTIRFPHLRDGASSVSPLTVGMGFFFDDRFIRPPLPSGPQGQRYISLKGLAPAIQLRVTHSQPLTVSLER
jgi:hypothetical protein